MGCNEPVPPFDEAFIDEDCTAMREWTARGTSLESVVEHSAGPVDGERRRE